MCGCVWKRKGSCQIVAVLIGKLINDGEQLDLGFSYLQTKHLAIP